MLKRLALSVAFILLLEACGESGYAEIPIEKEPTKATAAQQERYGVDDDTLVLLELLPTSYRFQTGPYGGFHYQPYELVFDCEGYLPVQENYEYKKFLRPQGQAVGHAADCPSGHRPQGFTREPGSGDVVWVGVIDSENDDWGILVVATEKDG